MYPDELKPERSPDQSDVSPEPLLPGPLQRVPRKAQQAARELLALSSKDRANLFRAFRKAPPPIDGVATPMPRPNGQKGLIAVQAEMWQGPLPSPESLARYNEISPGLAEKIVDMAKQQQTHRFGLENRTVDSQLSQSTRGQYFALILGLVAITAATYLGLTDHPVVAGIIAGPTIIGFAAMFIAGKMQERASREAKAPRPPQPARGARSDSGR